MVMVNVHEAKTHLSSLLAQVEGGEEVIIARAGRPVARLVAVQESKPAREWGTAKGEVWISDDFNAPLPDDLLDEFEK